MQHLSEEQLVAHYYHDDDAPAAAESHLAGCTECRLQFDTIRRVLTLVGDAPVPERGETYADQVWTRLRWKLGARRRRARWTSLLAAAAVLAVAFFAGQWWHARNLQNGGQAPSPVQQAANKAGQAGAPVLHGGSDRVLLVVVSDHLESSERMLTEVANADPRRNFDVAGDRAAELVASNRIYRQTATSRGDQRIATLLSDIEPILVELSHAGKTIGPEELAEIQKRIESKGLLFKVRVMSTQTGSGGDNPTPAKSNSL
jgi:hypothetical protein